MNTPKTILLGLLCAGAFLTFGSVAQARRVSGTAMVRPDHQTQVNAALVAEIARARAASSMAFAPGATSLLRLGL